MTIAVTLVRLFPAALVGRLTRAFVEIVLAAVVLSGSVVVGHHLKALARVVRRPGDGSPLGAHTEAERR